MKQRCKLLRTAATKTGKAKQPSKKKAELANAQTSKDDAFAKLLRFLDLPATSDSRPSKLSKPKR